MGEQGETLSYDASGMRGAGSGFDRASDPAQQAASRLSGASIPGSAFGRFVSAAPLAATLGVVRDEHARATRAAAELMQSLAARSAATAGMGEQLVTDTSAIARAAPDASAVADRVRRGM